MQSAPIHSLFVRQLFSNADRIEGSQFLRREIANRMREKLELVNLQANDVLDAGCAEGADLHFLKTHYPMANIIGVDASEVLLKKNKRLHFDAQSTFSKILQKWTPKALQTEDNFSLINGDFSNLSIKLSVIDVIWANLSLHWHSQPDKVFAEWHRVLRENGLVIFSCFGPDTFIELRQAFEGVDQDAHFVPFVDMHDYGDMLVKAGYATPVMDMEKITLEYVDPVKLLSDVRALGGNPLQTRRNGLLGKDAYRKILANLEAQRNARGVISLSFEIIYGHAFKPVQSKLAKGESVIRLDFPKKN
jgi:malonyl-CoA O-methyltransferase